MFGRPGAIHTKGNNMNRVLFLPSMSLAVALSMPANAETDWSSVDTIFARKAAVSGDVHRYGCLALISTSPSTG